MQELVNLRSQFWNFDGNSNPDNIEKAKIEAGRDG